MIFLKKFMCFFGSRFFSSNDNLKIELSGEKYGVCDPDLLEDKK